MEGFKDMFCSFCGKEIKDGVNFCSQCGAKQQVVNNYLKRFDKNSILSFLKSKKGKVTIVAFLTALVIICSINFVSARSIVGVWMSGTKKITFTKEGDFKMNSAYGTYTIEDDKTLIMSCGEYSYLNGKWEYEYGEEAKEDSDFWYISGDTLYLRGSEYKRK